MAELISILEETLVQHLVDVVLPIVKTAEHIIDVLRPAALVTTYFVGSFERALTFFAQKIGVPTFGSQFGNRFSWEYQLCTKPLLIEPCTRNLPATSKFILPETIIAYSQDDQEFFVDVCQYPAERVVTADSDWRLFFSAPFSLPQGIWPSTEKRKILYLPFRTSKDIHGLLMEQLDPARDQIVIKAHPIHTEPAIDARERFHARGFDVRVEIAYLHALMNSADVIVSFYKSTATQEALYFDKPLVVYSEDDGDITMEIIRELPRLERDGALQAPPRPSAIPGLATQITTSGYGKQSFEAFQEKLLTRLRLRLQNISMESSS